MASLLKINAQAEKFHILKFIDHTLKDTGIKKVILGLSSGIDSTTILYLLKETIARGELIVVHLNYFEPDIPKLKFIMQGASLPFGLLQIISIKKMADAVFEILQIPNADPVRRGNVTARVRMVTIYDLAKKNNALVCGTENRSEYHLGYFTRFGDEASDFEPIRHLYKTQLYQLAKYLKVPNEIIHQTPTAGLWPGQTDENELGFSYKEADPVLYLYFDKGLTIEQIRQKGYVKIEQIIERAKRNAFKHKVPYKIEV